MSEQNKTRIADFLDRALSSGEIAATGEYFHADMVGEIPFLGQEQIAEDNRVLTRFVWEGTQLRTQSIV